MKQLLLSLPTQTDYSAAAYLPTAGSAAARAALEAFAPASAPHSGQLLVLVGPAASGKTHLLNIWKSAHPEASATVADDLHQLSPEGQTGLFHAVNANKEVGGALLLASRVPAQQLDVLPDLKSRLLAAQHVHLAPPDDAELKRLVVKWSADRQLSLAPEVLDYLLARAERSPATLLALVAALDSLSLETRRAVTVPLARKLFEETA